MRGDLFNGYSFRPGNGMSGNTSMINVLHNCYNALIVNVKGAPAGGATLDSLEFTSGLFSFKPAPRYVLIVKEIGAPTGGAEYQAHIE